MYYPLFVDLAGRRCVVVGGGAMAESKVEALVECGAEVVVISPQVTEKIRRWVEEGRLRWEPRAYRLGDLEGAWLVVSAPDDRSLNRAVWEEAQARRVWVNAVDDPPHCSFIAPAVYRQGELVLAVSTSGKAPALAVRLRDRLAAQLGPEYAAFLELAAELRGELVRRVPQFERRRALWYRILDSGVLDDLQAGARERARERFLQLVEEWA
ncbi:MAG: bifunctional precorrin-2 dehydrogenase/sirohydrochlorin ferrochelatase [Armatimonadota bacterium]|nr:bifunctional precorrin-2 dehydrogenase/sirohydrochlorin ferrochelatase [Armatimonadota bacterium]MDR7428634.1 bifunctional precorrin-2 dehydrogenase/sirohydrochlorin ferrochelatase [Armatimonadota bacterium]MDR7432400.1 bifunctional precorrin-2 dehydrogenase/sirohydrochlorin ferrochelatase [Armatimonadota bacterium]MDR7541870.1 bifunctional precorrin-2 dehydrogenase/sirohydrochlorin ferrochelatase [Armatimonadota bacterium]MDR7606022.1 bifunctional precorrin-2 dehydrogenase/sirohydrochlorin 